MREYAFLFDCGDDTVPGIIAMPSEGESVGFGVLIVVGGPQYRVGSHRQFVLLSRHLARNGVPCMRFDYRGMGDGEGSQRSFEVVDQDIAAAIDTFYEHVPDLRGVLLWGLCDGATAACFYASSDSRVKGLMLLNPWVKTESGEARAYIKYYYVSRVLSVAFWRKLLAGGVRLQAAIIGLFAVIRRARGQPASKSSGGGLAERMAEALRRAALPTLIVLSGRDYVAREFDESVGKNPCWFGLDAVREPLRFSESDHTFSSAACRGRVEDATLSWVQSLAAERVGGGG